MRLWIAEKPSVASDIVNALGGNFTRHDGYYESSSAIVSFCVGHVLEMVPPEVYNPAYKTWSLDTLPLKLYPVQLQPKQSVAQQASRLISLIKRPDIIDIVHCGDPDDEGQLLVDEVLEFAGNVKPVMRALINDNSPPAVKKALTLLKDNKQFRGMYLKALMRSVGDATYGYSLSRAYTIKAKEKGYSGVMSVGRVQTPVLGLIVRRWREFTSHDATFYYTLKGYFTCAAGEFSAAWKVSENAPADNKNRLSDSKFAEHLAASLAGQVAIVKASAVDGKEEAAPLPFNLARLQQHMNRKEKLSAQETLDITQALREKHKAITYNRSDCSYLSDEQYHDAPQLVSALKTLDAYKAIDADASRKSKAFDTQKVTAHTAIIPTLSVPDLSLLTLKERLVYLAIAEFYLAQFMPKKAFQEASVIIESGREMFETRARKLTDAGFSTLLGEDRESDEQPDEENGAFDVISRLRTGGEAACKTVDVSEKKTKPAPLFTEASLMGALVRVADFVSDPRIKQLLKEKDKDKAGEHGGIGTPATRAAIIETLKKRDYVTVEKGKFIPTAAGLALIDALPDVASQPDMTAVWAEKQAAIQRGDMSIEKFIDGLYDEIIRMVETAEINIAASEKIAPKNRLDAKCPSCGGEIAITATAVCCTGCQFKIRFVIAGKTLTLKQIETIITKGKSSELKGFVSSKTPDKPFTAFVVLKDAKTGTIGFEFPPRKDSK